MTTPTVRMLDGPITTLREREIKIITQIAESIIQYDPNAEDSRQRLEGCRTRPPRYVLSSYP